MNLHINNNSTPICTKQVVTPKEEMDRVLKLSRFQFKIVSHALTNAPASVRYVSYSTCSIYHEEDESVVKDLLNKHAEHWQVAPHFAEAVDKVFSLKKENRDD